MAVIELKLNTIAQEDTAFLKARLANGANLKSTKQFYKPMKKTGLTLTLSLWMILGLFFFFFSTDPDNPVNEERPGLVNNFD